jgi:hypothetical protein
MDDLNNGVIMKIAKSQIFSNPICALAGLIKCKCCDATIEQVSTEGGGYYGCRNAKGESCDNKQQISRSQVEAIILNDLKEKFITLEFVAGQYSTPHAQSITTSSYYVAHTSIQTVALLDGEF